MAFCVFERAGIDNTGVVPIDPISIAAEFAATNAFASISGKLRDALKRRECRRQLAGNTWAEVVKRSDGRLRRAQGYLDLDLLWRWTQQPEVHAALLSADPAQVRQHGGTLREVWRTSTYDETNPMSDADAQLAAETVFFLLVVDVLAGDELLSTYAARILDAIDDVHNELALVCVTLTEAHADATDATRRRLAAISDGVLRVADRGLTEPGGDTFRIRRQRAQTELTEAIEGLSAGTALVVVGQPDVGKSHLTSTVLRQMRRDRDIFALDLRRHQNSVSDFESLLGDNFPTAIAAPGDSLPPVVALDGAEVIQSVGPELMQALVSQAIEAGCCVVIISRSDAYSDIRQALAASGVSTSQFEVAPLALDDLDSVRDMLPNAQALMSLPVGAWLARRPGLLQAWLLIEPDVPIKNEGHLVDLLRHRYIDFPGAGRQARLDAANGLARAELGDDLGDIDPVAVEDLRGSGVLAGRNNSWENRLAFSDDLWRDAAVAGLVASDPEALGEYSAIRPAMRAASIACQLRLNADPESVRSLVASFERIAARTNQVRWGEVPFEAMSSLGGSSSDWTALLDQLATGGMLERFLSTASRTSNSLMSDAPLGMAGLIDALLDNHSDNPHARPVLRAWLEAAAIHAPTTTSPARQRACRFLVGRPPGGYPSDHDVAEWLNDIAMCGVDLTPEAAGILRRTVAERPNHLDAIFRSFRTGFALAEGQPDLLIELSESYYVVRAGWSIEALRSPYRGMGPRFGALHTPLPRLLRVRPPEAMALVSRILDAACERGFAARRWPEESDHEPETTSLELPGRGEASLVGGVDAWMWYRGGLASPASAVSLLLATERFADQLIATGRTVDEVTEFVLRETSSLPLVGLCFGLCVRHLDVDSPSDALLAFASQTDVWHLEIARLGQETIGFGILDTNEVANEERRQIPITALMPQLSAAAVLRNDELLSARLEAVSAALEAGSPEDPVVRMWAWSFRPSAMRVEVVDGTRTVVMEAPDDLADAIAALQAGTESNEADSIAMRYVYRSSSELPADELAADVARCRSEASSGNLWGAARINTAAAVVRAAVFGEAELTVDDLRWAVSEIVGFPLTAQADPSDEEQGLGDMWRPIAALASAIPPIRASALRGTCGFEHDRVLAQAEVVARNVADRAGAEILWIMFAQNASLWQNPCDGDADACPNLIVKELCHTILDRSIGEIARPIERAFDDHGSVGDGHALETTRYIQPDILLAPLALAATTLEFCTHVNLDDVLERGLPLHSEAFRELGRSAHTDGNHFPRMGQVLFSLVRRGRVELVGGYIEQLAPSYQAQALQGFRQVAGDDPTLRPVLGEIWPRVVSRLHRVLLHDDRWTDAHAELVPSVFVDAYSMSQPDAWNEASANWVDPRAVEASLVEWCETAAGCGKCTGALGSFMFTADADWLRDVGLPLLSELVATVATDALKDRSAAWLADIPNEPRLADALRGNEHLLAIVDRYAQADDYYALMARAALDPGNG